MASQDQYNQYTQNQYTQNLQNQYNTPVGNQYQTFSAAAVVAPVVLWSGNSQGNVYLAAKNTFLEFYTEERKAAKRNACARSASCDSTFKDCDLSTTDAHSPSNRSLNSSEKNSPDTTPRSKLAQQQCNMNVHHNNIPQQYQYQETNYYQDNNCENYDLQGAQTNTGGYPVMMVPMMMQPVSMPCVNEQQQAQEQEMQHQPKVIKPNMPCKKQDLRELNTEPVDEITTLMIRGIPCSFSQDTLMKLIDSAGLRGKYDFFYLPRAGNNGSNLGYAFINFTNSECAEICMTTFNGVPLDPPRSTKICTISPADIQGLACLRKHFRRTAVSRGSRGPVFLKVFSEEDSNQHIC